MNEVFIIGKVVTEVKFDFILSSKNISVNSFRLITVYDKQEINVITYDEMSDYTYANIKLGNIVMQKGYLENDKVILEYIHIMN